MSDPNNLVYREQLDDNVIDMLSEDIGSNYSLRTENTKTIASALNEIRGKDIIANAVGDPLLNTDSYSDMGSKIRQMTNVFKTQLINKGVTISSYDKLNSLINKINEIVGDGNSGIQVATGIVNSNSSSEWFARTNSGRTNAYRVEVSNLSFKPNLVIIYYNDGTNNKINSIGFGDTLEFIYNNISGVTSISDTWYAGMLEPKYNDSASGTSGTIIPKFNDNGFLFYTGIPSTEFTYLAYGLGESQTDALTESLKQILIDNGAIVEGNESLSELILKTDELLVEKNQQLNRTDETVKQVLNAQEIAYDENSSTNELIDLLFTTLQLLYQKTYLYRLGGDECTAITGDYVNAEGEDANWSEYTLNNGYFIYHNDNANFKDYFKFTKNPIDVTNYSKLRFDIYFDTGFSNQYVCIGFSNSISTNPKNDSVKYLEFTNSATTTEIDLSDLSGEYYLFIYGVPANGYQIRVQFSNIWLERIYGYKF